KQEQDKRPEVWLKSLWSSPVDVVTCDHKYDQDRRNCDTIHQPGCTEIERQSPDQLSFQPQEACSQKSKMPGRELPGFHGSSHKGKSDRQQNEGDGHIRARNGAGPVIHVRPIIRSRRGGSLQADREAQWILGDDCIERPLCAPNPQAGIVRFNKLRCTGACTSNLTTMILRCTDQELTGRELIPSTAKAPLSGVPESSAPTKFPFVTSSTRACSQRLGLLFPRRRKGR